MTIVCIPLQVLTVISLLSLNQAIDASKLNYSYAYSCSCTVSKIAVKKKEKASKQQQQQNCRMIWKRYGSHLRFLRNCSQTTCTWVP